MGCNKENRHVGIVRLSERLHDYSLQLIHILLTNPSVSIGTSKSHSVKAPGTPLEAIFIFLHFFGQPDFTLPYHKNSSHSLTHANLLITMGSPAVLTPSSRFRFVDNCGSGAGDSESITITSVGCPILKKDSLGATAWTVVVPLVVDSDEHGTLCLRRLMWDARDQREYAKNSHVGGDQKKGRSVFVLIHLSRNTVMVLAIAVNRSAERGPEVKSQSH